MQLRIENFQKSDVGVIILLLIYYYKGCADLEMEICIDGIWHIYVVLFLTLEKLNRRIK